MPSSPAPRSPGRSSSRWKAAFALGAGCPSGLSSSTPRPMATWAARARLGPLRISGFDRFAGGTGEMRWRLLGHVPVVNATGPDLDRSAAGRVALDAMLVPTAFLSPLVSWSDGPRPGSATAGWTVGARTLQTELGVGRDGELRSVVMPRWGNPDGHAGGSTRAAASSPARPASAGSDFQPRCGPGGSSIPVTGPKASSSALRSPRRGFSNPPREPRARRAQRSAGAKVHGSAGDANTGKWQHP
jgi:hypothetical protein